MAVENGHLWFIYLIEMLMFHSYVSLPKGIGYVNYPHFGGLHYPNSTEFPGYFSPAAVDRARTPGSQTPGAGRAGSCCSDRTCCQAAGN